MVWWEYFIYFQLSDNEIREMNSLVLKAFIKEFIKKKNKVYKTAKSLI